MPSPHEGLSDEEIGEGRTQQGALLPQSALFISCVIVFCLIVRLANQIGKGDENGASDVFHDLSICVYGRGMELFCLKGL